MLDFVRTILRFILAVLLIPAVLACTIAFLKQLARYPSGYQDFYLWGVLGFLLSFLFVYQFWGVYEWGQKTFGQLFKFLAPVDVFIVRAIPFYLVIDMVLFFLAITFFDTHKYDYYFMFFAGFAMAMHLLLMAQEMQEAEQSAIKPAYLFTMSVIYIINISIAVFLIGLVIDRFTFPQFFKSMWAIAEQFYTNSIDNIPFVN